MGTREREVRGNERGVRGNEREKIRWNEIRIWEREREVMGNERGVRGNEIEVKGRREGLGEQSKVGFDVGRGGYGRASQNGGTFQSSGAC